MTKRAGRSQPRIGELMIRGAQEAIAHKRGTLPEVRVTRAGVTIRHVDVIPPAMYGERDVQRVREHLGLSQTVFANLIGASTSTVRAWERGARQPSDMARRLLELADRQPEHSTKSSFLPSSELTRLTAVIDPTCRLPRR